MANVLDLRRRIRSVKNTRQITKAMKMVSAAKLRRAQERAMLARPYAQMLSNVLESLVRRTDLYDDETGDVIHPLLIGGKQLLRLADARLNRRRIGVQGGRMRVCIAQCRLKGKIELVIGGHLERFSGADELSVSWP